MEVRGKLKTNDNRSRSDHVVSSVAQMILISIGLLDWFLGVAIVASRPKPLASASHDHAVV